MTASDAERFITARWPLLVRTAYLVTGSAAEAERYAAETLGEIDRRWSRVLEEGTPAARARALLARRLLAEDRAAPTPVPEQHAGGTATRELLDAYATLPTVDRLALALDQVEGVVGSERADALGRTEADVDVGLAEARTVLAQAQARAYAAVDLVPPDLDTELGETLRTQAEQGGLVADPLPLLRHARAARRRRRGLGVVAGVAVAAVAALVWSATGSGVGATDSGPSVPVQSPITSWPARGKLADAPATRRDTAQWWNPATHLLYADDDGGTRLIVGWTPAARPGRIDISVLAATAFTPTPAPFFRYETDARATSFILTGPVVNGQTSLLVLAPPSTRTAQFSTRVDYAVDGTTSRSWSTMPTWGGVGYLGMYGAEVPALRVQVAGYDGPPANAPATAETTTLTICPNCSAADWRGAVARWGSDQLSAATQVPVSRITATVLASGVVHEAATDVVTPPFSSDPSAPVDVACIDYLMPDGARVLSTSIRAPAFGETLTRTRLTVVSGTGAPNRPCVMPSPWTGPDGAGYIVATAYASRTRLSPDTIPGGDGPYVDISGGAAVVTFRPSLTLGDTILEIVEPGGEAIQTWPFEGLVDTVDPFDSATTG